MKKIMALFLAGVLLFSFTACSAVSGSAVYTWLDKTAAALGRSQITSDADLIGERTVETDAFSGEYTAHCRDDSGRDVIFGGGRIRSGQLFVSGKIRIHEGSATVIVRINKEKFEIPLKADGSFSMTLDLQSGGNYVMIDYDDFTGSAELASSYVDDATLLTFTPSIN